MNESGVILIAVSVVVVADLLLALYYRNLADRVESGDTTAKIDPLGARRAAFMLVISAPMMWLIVFLVCFGIIPTGLDPARF